MNFFLRKLNFWTVLCSLTINVLTIASASPPPTTTIASYPPTTAWTTSTGTIPSSTTYRPMTTYRPITSTGPSTAYPSTTSWTTGDTTTTTYHTTTSWTTISTTPGPTSSTTPTPYTTTTPSTPSTTPTSEPTSTKPTTPPSPVEGKIWALLVAGSNGFYNYRHQADICHAYQILHRNGIPDENIIVMMYDDIANNADNPKHGVIINKPDGPNVYKGVLKDYTGEEVNSTNFLNILKGDKDALEGIGSGRVIESGPNDHIFVNFADHGAPGSLIFPNDELLADDLIATLVQMAEANKFKKMVLYIEACYSGSMFDALLPDNIEIFVTTAADPHESSYACYYDDDIGTYLGDVFSVNWMEDSDREQLDQESLNRQFEIVRTETKTSHVEEYGDLDIGSTKLSTVIGKHSGYSNKIKNETKAWEILSKFSDAVPSYDVPVAILKKKLQLTKGKYDRQDVKMKLHQVYKKRKVVDKLFADLIVNVAGGNKSREDAINEMKGSLDRYNFPCYRSLFTHFSERCFRVAKNPYVAVHLQKFVNFCSLPWTREPTMLDAINRECNGWQKQFVGVHSII